VSRNPEGRGWFFRDRVCRIPTWRTWLLVLVCLVLLGVQFLSSIHPFLALSDPVRGDILVVEGWLPDDAMAQALSEFRRGGYRLMVTTGEPLIRGSVLSEYGTYAELGAAILHGMGADQDSLFAVPSPPARVNRTYASAVALAHWFRVTGRNPAAVDVVSLGAHARRSRDLFQLALGETRVGIIAAGDRSYDPERWWQTSRGVQSVMEETVGYLYSFVRSPEEEG